MAELGGSDPPVRGDDPASERDAALVRALRAGDERAFAELVDAFGPQMLRVARGFTPSRSVAEEVVQEAWLAVLQGLDRFEGRSSLKTWIFRILTNQAITRGTREHRSVPFSSLGPAEEPDQPAVDPTRFQGPRSRHPGDWASPP